MYIQKVINLNSLISDLKQYFDIVTYGEYTYNSCMLRYKIHTLFYRDEDISLLVVNNKYRLCTHWNGATFDYNTIGELEKSLDSALLELEQNI